MNHVQDLILIAFFLLTSLISGTLSSKFQLQTEIAKKKERTAQLLYDISESFLYLTGTSSIVRNGINYIYKYTGYSCSVALDNKKFHVEEDSYSTSDFMSDQYHENDLYKILLKKYNSLK